MQNLPLDVKIEKTKNRIREWVECYGIDKVYVSFSGGKDSTVLLDIARRMYPDMLAVYVDTGLEFPELRDFVKTVDNVKWLKPEMNFRKVIEKYGYPVISKNVAQRIYDARSAISKGNEKTSYAMKYLNGERINPKTGEKSFYNLDKWKFLLDAPFKIGGGCCNEMKKKPMKKYKRETGKVPIIGDMAYESMRRKTTWMREGCNAFNQKEPKSNPLSFWKEHDIFEYLLKYDIPYASIYGDIIGTKGKNHYTTEQLKEMAKTAGIPDNIKLSTTGEDRTGCVFCMFGCHLEKEPNKFQRLKESHPALWRYCMKPWDEGGLGIKEVLDFIKVKSE